MNKGFKRTINKSSSLTAMETQIATSLSSQTIANKQSAVTMEEIWYMRDGVWRGIGDKLGYLPTVIVKCQTISSSLPRFTSGAVGVTLPVIAGPMPMELPLDFANTHCGRVFLFYFSFFFFVMLGVYIGLRFGVEN